MADTATLTIKDFAVRNYITMTCERVDSNPNMDDSRDMDHWKCTLRRVTGDRERLNGDIRKRTLQMTLTFSQGYGHHGAEPEVDGVLNCLASDSSTIENTSSFADFCSEFGYDEDSRKAERTYKTCEHQAARLKRFLGDDLYQTLLYNTEAL